MSKLDQIVFIIEDGKIIETSIRDSGLTYIEETTTPYGVFGVQRQGQCRRVSGRHGRIKSPRRAAPAGSWSDVSQGSPDKTPKATDHLF